MCGKVSGVAHLLEDIYRVALAQEPTPHDTSVESGVLQVQFLGNPGELAVYEVTGDGLAGAGISRDLDLDATKLELVARVQICHVQTRQRDVLPHTTGIDGVAFSLEPTQGFERVEAEGLHGPTVVLLVIVVVTDYPELPHHRLVDWQLGHATAGDVDAEDRRDAHADLLRLKGGGHGLKLGGELARCRLTPRGDVIPGPRPIIGCVVTQDLARDGHAVDLV